jgi:hypothetical protein
VIQDAIVEADQLQSRVVSMATDPWPPVAGTFDSELVTASWHFGVDGAVELTCVDDESQPATTRQANTAMINGTKSAGRPIFSGDHARAPPSTIDLQAFHTRARTSELLLASREMSLQPSCWTTLSCTVSVFGLALLTGTQDPHLKSRDRECLQRGT